MTVVSVMKRNINVMKNNELCLLKYANAKIATEPEK